VLSGEATDTNFIAFGLSRPGLEPTIDHTQVEHSNHYATEAAPEIFEKKRQLHVPSKWLICSLIFTQNINI
jgi:hypothetical protein